MTEAEWREEKDKSARRLAYFRKVNKTHPVVPVRFWPEEVAKMDAMAKKMGINRSEFIRTIVRAALD